MTDKSPCNIVEAVRKDLLDRSRLGVKKYGTTLAGNKAVHVERLQHAYEEALDLANYLKWSILQLQEKTKPVSDGWDERSGGAWVKGDVRILRGHERYEIYVSGRKSYVSFTALDLAKEYAEQNLAARFPEGQSNQQQNKSTSDD